MKESKVFIPHRFLDEIRTHLFLNYSDQSDYPLIMGIFGSPVDGTPRCSRVDGHRRLTEVQMCVSMPTRRTTNRSGYTTAPGQPGCHVRTDLPAPSTGRHGAARSIDTDA